MISGSQVSWPRKHGNVQQMKGSGDELAVCCKIRGDSGWTKFFSFKSSWTWRSFSMVARVRWRPAIQSQSDPSSAMIFPRRLAQDAASLVPPKFSRLKRWVGGLLCFNHLKSAHPPNPVCKYLTRPDPMPCRAALAPFWRKECSAEISAIMSVVANMRDLTMFFFVMVVYSRRIFFFTLTFHCSTQKINIPKLGKETIWPIWIFRCTPACHVGSNSIKLDCSEISFELGWVEKLMAVSPIDLTLLSLLHLGLSENRVYSQWNSHLKTG